MHVPTHNYRNKLSNWIKSYNSILHCEWTMWIHNFKFVVSTWLFRRIYYVIVEREEGAHCGRPHSARATGPSLDIVHLFWLAEADDCRWGRVMDDSRQCSSGDACGRCLDSQKSALSFDFLLEVRKVFTSFGGSQCLFGSWRLISVRVLIVRNNRWSLVSHGASRVLQIFKTPACDFRG